MSSTRISFPVRAPRAIVHRTLRHARAVATWMVLASAPLCFTVVTLARQAPSRPTGAAATPLAAPVTYRVTVPEPEHHWLQVDATFPGVGTRPLDVHMSRSSPGRYAVHEFAKNVFSFEAFDGKGRKLTATRPSPYEWRVAGHDGTVRIVYKLFGDLVDGTYLAVDTSHAHMNMPATFMWADGLEDRPARFIFANPAGHDWNVATQLYPTGDPLTFTAPNLQYFMDSPTEFSNFVLSTFDVTNADGKPAHFRVVAHADGSQADVDELATLIKRIVTEDMQVFGELPQYEPGHYTFLLDYMPWNAPDGMEHRNSTCITEPGAPASRGVTLRTPQGREAALDAISHEFFHSWNVERIRPVGIEPFDFTRANITCCLWLAEGFTQYYGRLQLFRAGLVQQPPVNAPAAVINGSGRSVRSAVEMSEWAAFADAARSVDPTDQSRSFISYYTYGSAIALALDLSIREVSSGTLSLDDYMKLLWKLHGKPGGPAPGLVGKPYSLKDVRDHLAELTGNRRFADDFFDRYIEGRDAADYAHLLSLAGYVVRRTNPQRAWLGDVQVQEQAGGLIVGSGGGGRGAGGATLVPFGTPIYDAGIEGGDVITMIDATPATMAGWMALSSRKIGDKVAFTVRHRDGTTATTTAAFKANPSIQTTPAENVGTLTDAQKAFRQSWLATKVR